MCLLVGICVQKAGRGGVSRFERAGDGTYLPIFGNHSGLAGLYYTNTAFIGRCRTCQAVIMTAVAGGNPYFAGVSVAICLCCAVLVRELFVLMTIQGRPVTQEGGLPGDPIV